jgi:hypothetical protein
MGRYLDLIRRAEKKRPASSETVERASRGTVGQPYAPTLDALRSRRPDYVPHPRWERAVADSARFISLWGEQALALEWSPRDLWGLHKPPDNPPPSYSRLSRYDQTGLLWLLEGRNVTALSSETAVIKSATGAVTRYRKHNKPARGPLGDSLDDFEI